MTETPRLADNWPVGEHARQPERKAMTDSPPATEAIERAREIVADAMPKNRAVSRSYIIDGHFDDKLEMRIALTALSQQPGVREAALVAGIRKVLDVADSNNHGVSDLIFVINELRTLLKDQEHVG